MGHVIEQRCGGHIADHRTPPSLVLEKVVIEDHQKLVRVQKVSLVIDNPESVGVAIGRYPKSAAIVHHIALQRLQRSAVGRWHAPPEQRVVTVMNDVYLAAGRHKDGLQRSARDPEHRVQCDLQVGTADGLHVHLLDDRVDVAVERIDLADQTSRNCLLVGHLSDPRLTDALKFRHAVLKVACHHLVGIPAARREHLDPVVEGRIVGRRYGHAVGQPEVLNSPHDQRCWRLGDPDHPTHHSFSCEHLCRPCGGDIGKEPPVVPDHDPLVLGSLLLDTLRERSAQQPHVAAGEFVTDDRPPATGTEVDARHGMALSCS